MGLGTRKKPRRSRGLFPRRLLSSFGVALGLCAALTVSGSAEKASAVTPIRSDLEFILLQIKRAEAHAAGGNLAGPGPLQIGSPLLPYGLRTVDGTYNNIIPGQEMFGAADRMFPRLLDPFFRPAESGDLDGPFGPMPPIVSSSYAQKRGTVIDSRPRIISNLIVDQTTDNPAAQAAFDQTPNSELSGDIFFIPNRAPDTGLSAPYNSWFTLFGQFFDHGLDLTTKGRAGTVIVPLQADDPLFDPLHPETNFMVLTRATNLPGDDGIAGDDPTTPMVDESADDIQEHTNTTTPFVDQNQTYTSHPSHQVFLRDYETNGAGLTVASGKMFDRPTVGGLATWADVKLQAEQMLGIELDDQDIFDVPLLVTDPYGKYEPGPGGYAKLVTDNDPVTTVSGTPGSPADATAAIGTGHAFLDDIAHFAVPFGDHDGSPFTPRQALLPDGDSIADPDTPPALGFYDDELLDAHFMTGDGRGNENIGLTSVHHVFHAEHNRLVADIEARILAENDDAWTAEWQFPNGEWNGERIFQAARFVTEMQYQHLVFEEFARKVQPQVNLFSGYHTEIDPAIVAEFAHTVYRFGHSMLTETVARTANDGTPNDMALVQAFLNPLAFNEGGLTPGEAAGTIARGMTGQVGNEIDEFVTPALRSNLLGLPLDLATINMLRGRDTGVPPLNAARRAFFAQTSHSALQPYESWIDYKLSIRHPESLVNFIAAYGTHPDLTDPAVDTNVERRDVAYAIVYGANGADGMNGNSDDPVVPVPMDRMAFLNSTGATWGNLPDGVTKTGVDDIDFWIGGLAEKQMIFGGLLGPTFNYVFETQMEKLQDGDRLYYLTRLAGLNLLTQLEENAFSEMVMRVTDTNHLPFDVFSRPDFTFEIDNINNNVDPNVIEDDPRTAGYNESDLLFRMPNGAIRFTGPEHVVFGGTDLNDRIHSSEGDDTFWGDGGNDRIEGGDGNDSINGGIGNDIITDIFGDENIKGGSGDDAVNAGSGFDLILAGFGNDFVIGGADPKETFAGGGDDFVYAGDSTDTVFANEGDDWVQGGPQADLLQGDNGDPFQQGRFGNDVVIGDGGNDDYDSEGGDDIMVTGPGIERLEGMMGYDWTTYARDPQAANGDLNRTVFAAPDLDDIADRFDLVEGLSGWNHNDILRGSSALPADRVDNTLTNMALIDGLQALVGTGVTSFDGDIILGGAGSDLIEGREGDDLLDGDKWLNVRISVRHATNPAVEIGTHNVMQTVQAAIFAGTISPTQLRIVREILPTPAGSHVDTAVFSDVRANYTITSNLDGSVTVAHTGGTAADGTDSLRNIEMLQFADTTVDLVAFLTNASPVGTVNISDTTPTEGQLLTATQAFTDGDGINLATLTFSWQAETAPGVWTNVGSGAVFTPVQAQVGRALRAIAGYTDSEGRPETVTSAPTAAVANINTPAAGAPAISDTTPAQGAALTASTAGITDPDGLVGVTFAFQWQERLIEGPFSNIPAATNGSFTPTAAQAGMTLRVVVSFTDNFGAAEAVNSAETAVVTGVSNAPVIGVASRGNATATVRWTPPDNKGGLALTGYNVRVIRVSNNANIGPLRTAGPNATSLVVTGLTNGVAYQFEVTAVNAAGTGPASGRSNSVQPAVGAVVTVPGAPVIGTAARGAAGAPITAIARWTPPAATGGSPITGYRVTALRMSSGAADATVLQRITSAVLPAAARQLQMTVPPGTYRFEVVTINAVGSSAPSVRSNAVVAR
ncbi:MAG: hypothetical protein QOF68_2238 [Gaiellales bacterium]|nr:hypothetical protein [Gaiellales bacterium]